MYKKVNKLLILLLVLSVFLLACKGNRSMEATDKMKDGKEQVESNRVESENIDEGKEENRIENTKENIKEKEEDNNISNLEEEEKMHVQALMPVKNPMNHNPLFTQAYSADPYAIVYENRVYLYMTADTLMYEADGSIKKNDYSNINTLHVISSEDLVNWTDHGEILAAGSKGAANWGNNSWAPAACWKEIDGKAKFFLYFANSGNGIAVLTSDSPTGPFIDPIGKPIVSRNTPTCAEVTWLFDPAVLVDDDGEGYLYFGGGVPSPDKAGNPGTARVVKLNDDMISLAEDPVPIENVKYLFEDSGINKVGDKYIYSYCSNFNVPADFKAENGFGNGEIIIMEGDNPMGPFNTVRSVLKNPEDLFKFGGNNHHCIFEFNGKWYITYHAGLIEEKLGANHGYRSVNIDEIEIDEDSLFIPAKGSMEGVKQVKAFDPFKQSLFATMSNQAGVSVSLDDNNVPVLHVNDDGAFTQISGVDFKEGAQKCCVNLACPVTGSLSIRKNLLNSEDIGKITLEASDDFTDYEINLEEKISGQCDIYFVFEGKGLAANSFVFQ